MSEDEIKVLVLEDSPTDILFLRNALQEDPLNLFALTVAERLAQGLVLLKQQTFDAILLDLGLPDSQGLMTFNAIHQASPNLPVVVFSGNLDEQDAIEAMRAGAQDYLVKNNYGFEMAGRALRHAIERHKLAHSLRESEARAQAMLSAIPDLMFRLSREGVFLDYRADIRDLFDQSGSFLGKRNRDIAPPYFADLLDAKISATLESGILQTFEYQLPIPERGWRDFEARMTPSGPDEVLAVVRDITEAKKVALTLKANEERLRLILETASDGFWIVNPQTRFMEVNQAYCTMSGYTREEFLKMRISDVEDIEAAKDTASHVQKILQQGYDRFESRHRRKDGSLFDVEVSVSLLNQDNDAPLMICFCRDITERKQTEDELRISAEKYRGIFDESVAAIYIFDEAKNFVDTNQAGVELLGYSRAELLQMSIPDVDADPAVVLPAHTELLSGGRLINYEHQLRRKDKTVITVLNNSLPLTNAEGKVTGMLSTLLDITERKRTEQAIYRYNAQLATVTKIEHALAGSLDPAQLMQILAQGAWDLFPDLAVVFVSSFDSKRQIIKAEFGLHKGVPIEVATLPEIPLAPPGEGTQSQVIRTRKPLIIQENFKEKIYANILVHIGNDAQETESALYVPMLAQDQILGLVQLQSYVPAHFTKEDTHLLTLVANTAAVALQNARLYALEQKEVAERKLAEVALNERLRELELLYQSGLALSSELDLKQIAGKLIEALEKKMNWHHVAIRRYDLENDRLELLAFNQPGLENEAQRQAIEARFNTLVSHSGQGLSGWVVGHRQAVRSGDVRIDKRYTETHADILSGLYAPMILGERVVGVVSVESEILNAFSESDERLLKTIANQAAVAFENAYLFEKLQGELVERQKAEEALRASEARYRLIADYVDDIVWQLNPDLQFVYTSPAVQRVLGYVPEEVQGMDVRDLLDTKGLNQMREVVQARLAASPIAHRPTEYLMKHKDGHWVDVEVVSSPVFDDRQNLAGFVGITRQITERKQAELALRASEEKYRSLALELEDRVRARTAEVQDLYENAPVGYHSLDLEGKFILINQTELTWFGHSREEVLGHSVKDFLTPASIAKFDENFPTFKKRRWLKNLELEFMRKDGSTFIALVNATIIYDKQGNYHLSRTTLQDITDRKAAETALRESEASLQDFLDTASDLIQRMDAYGHYTYVNKAWCRRLGYTLEEALQMDMFQVVAPTYHAHCQQVLTHLSQTGKSQDFEIAFQTKTGETIFVEGGVSIHHNANGQLTTNGIFRDITLRKQAEDTLRQSRDELRSANTALEQAARLKDEFLANMSHELRTPLNAILAFSEGLLEQYRGPLNERQLASVRSIEASGRHLLALINDILDLSKVEAGRLELQIQPLALADVCESSLIFVKEAASQKALKLTYQLDDHLAVMQADPKRLKQILVNLLSNAVKFTPAGGKVSLIVTPEADLGQVSFAVHDTGIGIAPEDLSHLFRPFTQLDSSLSRHHEGTGLGLALVRRLTELHGGSVAIESTVGEGSCFTVTLPYAPPVPKTVASVPPTTYRGFPQSALLVDDSESVVEQLTRYLDEMGIQTTVQPHGKEVLEQAEHLHPGVILLDLLMPDQSGWEILSQLKANPHTQDIPVIIISVAEERARGLAAGAADYMVKPISRESLRATLRATSGVPENRQPALVIVSQPETVRILLVEDNELSIQAMNDYLEARGYQIAIAHNGREALEQAREWQPHLILMDIQMPEMDGLEAIQRLRALPAFATTPIIALTALAMPGDRERCLAAGANDYLSKPVKLKALAESIQNLLVPKP